jgi:hypothetical protein
MSNQAKEYFRFWNLLTDETSSGRVEMWFLCKDVETTEAVDAIANLDMNLVSDQTLQQRMRSKKTLGCLKQKAETFVPERDPQYNGALRLDEVDQPLAVCGESGLLDGKPSWRAPDMASLDEKTPDCE